ncbi:MAG: hypothetical protein KDC34_18675 [Saprospiraceae bacterium]|nr:hypothetical protein [Saprospiraceae bacterium]
MKELIDKISSYNIFNYLFPGLIYVAILREFTVFDIYQENNFIGAFLYYFAGLVISRFGSLVIEPILKRLKFVKYASYEDYIAASDKDNKIELFSEINNMYRTLIAMLILLLLAKLFEITTNKLDIPQSWEFGILILALLTIFIFSYRKQTNYVVKRVDARKTDLIT